MASIFDMLFGAKPPQPTAQDAAAAGLPPDATGASQPAAAPAPANGFLAGHQATPIPQGPAVMPVQSATGSMSGPPPLVAPMAPPQPRPIFGGGGQGGGGGSGSDIMNIIKALG